MLYCIPTFGPLCICCSSDRWIVHFVAYIINPSNSILCVRLLCKTTNKAPTSFDHHGGYLQDEHLRHIYCLVAYDKKFKLIGTQHIQNCIDCVWYTAYTKFYCCVWYTAYTKLYWLCLVHSIYKIVLIVFGTQHIQNFIDCVWYTAYTKFYWLCLVHSIYKIVLIVFGTQHIQNCIDCVCCKICKIC